MDIILVGNKCDLVESRKVKLKEGEDLAKSYNVPFMETSAANASNIDKAFRTMAINIMERVEKEPSK